MRSQRKMTLFAIAMLLIGPSAVSAASPNMSRPAQDKPVDVSGKYEGTAKSQALGEIPITVEIKNEGGKLSGKIDTAQGSLPITGGTFVDGKIVMKFDAGGTEGTVTAKPVADTIVGSFEMAGQTGTVELKRVGAGASMKPPTTAGSPDPISGEWEAVAQTAAEPVPFSLKLKVDGQTVTGESTSAMGTAPAKGTWVGNKLTFSLDVGGQAITMTAVIKDGKLVGDYDFPGQGPGKWEATRKK